MPLHQNGVLKVPNLCISASESRLLLLHREGVEYGCQPKGLLLVWGARGSQAGLGWDITSQF